MVADSVTAALDARIRRGSRVRDLIYERIAQDVVLVDVAGSAVWGRSTACRFCRRGLAFGQPSRITARVCARAVAASWISNGRRSLAVRCTKGVMILQGFVAQHYLPTGR